MHTFITIRIGDEHPIKLTGPISYLPRVGETLTIPHLGELEPLTVQEIAHTWPKDPAMQEVVIFLDR